MKIALLSLVGFSLGLGLGVGLTLRQAEPSMQDGKPHHVVTWVYRNRIVQTPVWERCLVVGLGCGLLGGLAGYRLGAGGEVIPAVVGAVLVIALVQHVETLFPDAPGRAARQTRDLGILFAGLLGAAVGAEVSIRARAGRRGRAAP